MKGEFEIAHPFLSLQVNFNTDTAQHNSVRTSQSVIVAQK